MGSPYVGEVRIFAGTFAPRGWEFCNGQLISIAENTALFTLIGTTYGGDGVNTFGLPNLQGRIPFHMGTDGSETFVIGQAAGHEVVALSQGQLPVHNHSVTGSGAPASATSPTSNVWAAWADSPYATDTTPNTAMDPAGIGAAGGDQPHENLPPFVVLTYIISLFGIFPTPS